MVKEKHETLMKNDRKALISEEKLEDEVNGYCSRDWETSFGAIVNLEVHIDRKGEFNPKHFSPYERGSGGWRT